MILKAAEYLFLLVSDSKDFTEYLQTESKEIKGTGSHCSLLVYEKRTKSFLYYDSLKRYNLESDKKLAEKVFNLLETSEKSKFNFVSDNSVP